MYVRKNEPDQKPGLRVLLVKSLLFDNAKQAHALQLFLQSLCGLFDEHKEYLPLIFEICVVENSLSIIPKRIGYRQRAY